MKRLLRIHDVYIGRSVVTTVLLTWAVLVGLFVMMGVSDQFKDIGKGSYSFGHAVAYVAYGVPRNAYNLFPTAAVIGALMGLGQLAATSELTALRALGLSRRRLGLSVAATITLLTAVMVVNGETLAPWAQGQADVLKANAKFNTNMANARYSGLWAREGDTFINAEGGEEILDAAGGTSLQLHDVRLYQVGEDDRLETLTYATSAEHLASGWMLRGVRRDTFESRSVKREVFEQLPWESRLDPAALAAGLSRPRNLSVRDLHNSIEYRRRNGLDARDYEDQYWSRWFYPVNVLALCLAAVPFAFGSLRSGGMGKRLFLGVLFALGFWLLQLFFGRMAGALKLDYRIAYSLSPLMMLAISGWLFRRRGS
ncbi:MAG: LPS export ABC transporter permease LptG [Pseudomonas sp.]